MAISPAGYDEPSDALRELGVGYDRSPESGHALNVARTLGNDSDSGAGTVTLSRVAAGAADSRETLAHTNSPEPLSQ